MIENINTYFFFRWVYDFDKLSWQSHTSRESWQILAFSPLEETGYIDKKTKDHWDYESDPKYVCSPLGYNDQIKSETEEIYSCCKCSYKGKIWDFIEKRKQKLLKIKLIYF